MDTTNELAVREKTGVSRRQFIGLASLAGAGVVLAGSLTGCASDNKLNLDTDYLPLGSVVKISGDAENSAYRMIVARRPIVSKYYDNTTKSWKSAADKPIYDYAGLTWPLGFISDLSDHAYTSELVLFQHSEITEVPFVGWQNDQEKDANKALSAAMNSTKTSPEILYDLGQSLLSK